MTRATASRGNGVPNARFTSAGTGSCTLVAVLGQVVLVPDWPEDAIGSECPRWRGFSRSAYPTGHFDCALH